MIRQRICTKRRRPKTDDKDRNDAKSLKSLLDISRLYLWCVHAFGIIHWCAYQRYMKARYIVIIPRAIASGGLNHGLIQRHAEVHVDECEGGWRWAFLSCSYFFFSRVLLCVHLFACCCQRCSISAATLSSPWYARCCFSNRVLDRCSLRPARSSLSVRACTSSLCSAKSSLSSGPTCGWTALSIFFAVAADFSATCALCRAVHKERCST